MQPPPQPLQSSQRQQKLSYMDMRDFARRQEAIILIYSWISDTRILVWVVHEAFKEPATAVIQRKPKPLGFVRYLRSQYETLSDLGRYYDELISPIEDALFLSLPSLPSMTRRNLIIIPDGELFRVPFAALFNSRNKRHLIQDFVIRTSTSIGALQQLEHQHDVLGTCGDGVGRAVIVGDPRQNLPGSIREAKNVAGIMQDNHVDAFLLLQENATKHNVLGALPTGDYFHISAHGGHDFVELAGAEYLTLLDFRSNYSLPQTKLVVLSSCNTWKGKIRADGVYGLVRTLVGAGVSAVVATLWEVDDKDDRFMNAFYKAFFHSSCPAEAFHEAALALIDSNIPHTAWSPFVMLYDAKPLQKEVRERAQTMEEKQ